MDKNAIAEKIHEIAASAAAENVFELVHTEVVGSKRSFTVRVFIDKPGGITIDDCSLFSRRLEEILDADDFIPDAYILEVSSPGIERELYSVQDFEKFKGNLARVKTFKPIDGQRNFRGKIVGVEADEIIFEDKTTGTARFPFSAVAKANLEIDLEQELRGKK